jgi:hypothetical protein
LIMLKQRYAYRINKLFKKKSQNLQLSIKVNCISVIRRANAETQKK